MDTLPVFPVRHDAIVLGAGGAGMMCALTAGGYGKLILILDHMKKAGGKILISGGGRCNFTNTGASSANYVSQNPHFMKSAMSRFKPQDFIAMVEKHRIPYHEKKLGQQFCDNRAQDIVDLLVNECLDAGVEFEFETQIKKLLKDGDEFRIITSRGEYRAAQVVVALGGLSLPKVGATGVGFELARRFGHQIVETAPALDGFTWNDSDLKRYRDLAGVSLDCVMTAGGKSFRENLLFTHGGLSGPASLQASLHWSLGDTVEIRLIPDQDFKTVLVDRKRQGHRVFLKSLLMEQLPARFVEKFIEWNQVSELPLPQISDAEIQRIADELQSWTIYPSGTVGYSKAEVTRGGVSTDEVSSKTLESKIVPGLFFVGEVLDVTGWLGGYNYQWAWASGSAAGEAIAGVLG